MGPDTENYFVPDDKCKQGVCANRTTGCIGECKLDSIRSPMMACSITIGEVKTHHADDETLRNLVKLERQLSEAKAEIERLQAHNAMLVEGIESANLPHLSGLYPVFTALLSATPESAQQWLSEKLAQARKDAQYESRGCFVFNVEYGWCQTSVLYKGLNGVVELFACKQETK